MGVGNQLVGFSNFGTPGTPLPANAPFPNDPQYIIYEGMRLPGSIPALQR
jgi:hypothetical protein